MLVESEIRRQIYELLAHAVNPTADERRKLRARRGLVFLPVVARSYLELVRAHPKHYPLDERLYAYNRPELKDYRPPVAVEVGFIELNLALPNSFGVPRYEALQMITDYSRDEIAADFPAFQAIGLPATGYASADETYAQRNPGQVLFKEETAWCLDNLLDGDAANAGRGTSDGRFGAYGWYPHDGNPTIGGAPAVVKIGTK